MNNKEFIDELAKIRPGSTFLVLHKYKSNSGEIANYNIIFHISYKNALKNSIAIVEKFSPENNLQEIAQKELLKSYTNSLNNINQTPIEKLVDGYQRFRNEEGFLIEGVKLHTSTKTVHIFGFIHLKKVLTPVEFKKINSSPLTIEKIKIQRLCPVSKFRQFKSSQVEKIAVRGLKLLPPNQDE